MCVVMDAPLAISQQHQGQVATPCRRCAHTIAAPSEAHERRRSERRSGGQRPAREARAQPPAARVAGGCLQVSLGGVWLWLEGRWWRGAVGFAVRGSLAVTAARSPPPGRTCLNLLYKLCRAPVFVSGAHLMLGCLSVKLH